MKIATFNINNVNKRLANLLGWLATAQPDVVCLQELKAEDRAFPIAAIEAAGYGAVWRGQRTWNGVASSSDCPHRGRSRSTATVGSVERVARLRCRLSGPAFNPT